MEGRPKYWLTPITEEQRTPHACLNCEAAGAKPLTFPADGLIAVGFGSAGVLRDGMMVADGEDESREDFLTGAHAEAMAAADPEHDWRISIEGPMSGRTYQRQGEAGWVLVEQNEGFA